MKYDRENESVWNVHSQGDCRIHEVYILEGDLMLK
jgi:hypothetical protein